MWMLPGPHSGSFFAFDNIAVLVFFRIDQCYVSLVFFRFFIDQSKNTLCSGKCHNNGVKLLRHLHKRLCKALCKLQIRCHNSQSDPSDSHNRKESSKYRDQYKLQVSDVSDYRSHHICKGIRLCSTFKERLVEFVKFFF